MYFLFIFVLIHHLNFSFLKNHSSENLFYLVLTLCVLFTPGFIFGQESEDKQTYVWFDSLIDRTNSGIFSGLEYIEQYRMLNERHKYFMSPNFINGSVIFDSEPYYNLDLKYDVFEDQLILRHSDNPNFPTILLDKDKVSSFNIEGHEFQNLRFELKKGNFENGFFEVLSGSGPIVLYKKNYKRILKKTNDHIRYYEFKSKDSYFFKHQGLYYDLRGLYSLSAIFPEYRTELKEIDNHMKELKKDNTDAYLKSLIEELSLLIAKTTPSGI